MVIHNFVNLGVGGGIILAETISKIYQCHRVIKKSPARDRKLQDKSEWRPGV